MIDVAGSSSNRVSIEELGFTPGEAFDNSYEEDLLGLLDQLSPEEIDELQTLFARRMQTDSLSDRDIAMITLLQQVRELVHISEDRVLAQQIAEEDDMGVRTEQNSPDSDREDTRTATEESVDGGGAGIETEESSDGEDNIGTEHLHRPTQNGARSIRNRMARFLPRRSFSLISRLFGSTMVLAARARVALPRKHRLTGHVCVVCQDLIHGAEIHTPCGHYFDIDCATDLFQSATRDETLFPPRCCGKNIPFARMRPHLSRTMVRTFHEKRAEFSTLKRVYCSSPSCSLFLGPLSEGVFGGRVYTCPAPGCRRRTCGKCREQHSGGRTHVCCPDAGATQVLELSRASGWARCPGCAHLIELHLGCFHTTCRCGTEFCYLCHAIWKTCECPQWNEQLAADGDHDEE